MFFIIIIISVTSFAIPVNTHFFPDSKELLDCALRIYKETKSKKLLIQSNNNDELEYLVKRIDTTNTIISNKDLKITDMKYKFDYNIMTIKTFKEFEMNLNIFYRTYSWNSTAKYLLILTQVINVTKIFSLSWNYYLLNIMALKRNTENDNIEMITYFPFNGCGNINYKVIGTCNNNVENMDYFAQKIPLYFNACPVRILSVYFPPFILEPNNSKNLGLEATMVNEIARRINFTPIYLNHKQSSYGFKYAKGVYTKVFNMLYNYEADFVIGNVKLNLSFTDEFDTTLPHLKETVTWHAPVALEVPPWQNLIIVFEYRLWILILFTFQATVFVWWAFGYLTNDEYWKQFMNCFLNAWCSILLGTIKQPSNLKLRILLMSWVIGTIFLNMMYNTMFTSILTNPSYERQISTELEILQSRIQYGFDNLMKGEFNYPEDKIKWKIYNNHITCLQENFMSCMNRTLYNRDFILAKTKKIVSYYLRYIYKYSDGTARIYVFKKDVYKYHIRGLVNQGFPLIERYNQILHRIHSSGLLLKWNVDFGGKPLKIMKNDMTFQTISVTHLTSAVYVFIIGMSCSLIIFMLEIIVHYSLFQILKNKIKLTKEEKKKCSSSKKHINPN